MQGTMAVVTCWAADFAPKGWAYCNGQLLPIAQNQALFSLLGTTYGGNGTTNFALPDLRGRSVVSQGNGPGLSGYTLGQQVGNESTTLVINNMPIHAHAGNTNYYLQGDGVSSGESNVENNYPGNFAGAYAPNPTASVNMLEPAYAGTVSAVGGTQPFSVLMPYLVINHIICLQGIYPSRN
ncbi:phage tail protein [Paraflavitalea speifideaquila]|uniref:phage tail protein n=1 Tax=Paraflavitalea speifideaquila TaxID=3076558 RepID=UPI0028E2CD4C|nr:tail fiber protein [Paraflavitalea speifideiaquila]